MTPIVVVGVVAVVCAVATIGNWNCNHGWQRCVYCYSYCCCRCSRAVGADSGSSTVDWLLLSMSVNVGGDWRCRVLTPVLHAKQQNIRRQTMAMFVCLCVYVWHTDARMCVGAISGGKCVKLKKATTTTTTITRICGKQNRNEVESLNICTPTYMNTHMQLCTCTRALNLAEGTA